MAKRECCATCWFDQPDVNQSAVSQTAAHQCAVNVPSASAHGYCIIRDVAIEAPLATRCANHPARNPQRITMPIGPMRAAGRSTRTVRAPSLDTRQIRNGLLELLEGVLALPEASDDQIAGCHAAAISHVGDLGELRALPYLRRIAAWPDDAARPNRRALRAAALRTLRDAGRAEVVERGYHWREERRP